MWSMPVVHLTARMRRPHQLFLDPGHAGWFWQKVATCFPGLLAATQMPNHPHVCADVDDVGRARAKFGRICGHLARRAGIPELWEPIPPAESLLEPGKILRTVRYVALNPCRSRLVSDPLRWLWSTHRDVVGAIAEPVVDVSRLRDTIQFRGGDFVEWLHRYVSSDPSVRVDGTPLPRAAPVRVIPEVPLGAIARAAAFATRTPLSALRRRGPARQLFFALAAHQGWRDTDMLAQVTGLTPNAIRRARERPIPAHHLRAATLVLNDPRLLRPGPNAPQTCIRAA